jgi:hypothetical protein
MVVRMKSCWGHYVTHKEDCDIRQQKWNTHPFITKRLVMWDNTNVPLCFKPSDAEAQRNTYSSYYSGNVGKGGVYIQACGWISTHDLWMGAVSDTEYMIRGRIFERQQKFLLHRDYSTMDISWLNIFDRGYRNLGGKALNKSKQTVVQPAYSKSDGFFFSSYDTLRTAAVANVRSGNERAVHTIKTSKYISGGLKGNESCERMCNVWLCYGFQVNFMFRPTH